MFGAFLALLCPSLAGAATFQEDFSTDPCTWYWYKDPADIPERHWRRYGLERPARVSDAPG